MHKKNYGIALSPNIAYYVLIGEIPIVFLSECYSDADYFLIHSASYLDESDKEECENALVAEGLCKNIVPVNSIIGTAKVEIIEYDEERFKADVNKHNQGTDLSNFKAQNEWGDEPIFGYEFKEIFKLPKPILGITDDIDEFIVWEPESPFEELCFKIALNARFIKHLVKH